MVVVSSATTLFGIRHVQACSAQVSRSGLTSDPFICCYKQRTTDSQNQSRPDSSSLSFRSIFFLEPGGAGEYLVFNIYPVTKLETKEQFCGVDPFKLKFTDGVFHINAKWQGLALNVAIISWS